MSDLIGSTSQTERATTPTNPLRQLSQSHQRAPIDTKTLWGRVEAIKMHHKTRLAAWLNFGRSSASLDAPDLDGNAEAQSKSLLRPNFAKTRDMVTFLVGQGRAQETFVVHKAVTDYYSPMFRAAFNSTMKEGQEQSMTFEYLDPTIFGHLIHALYFNCKPSSLVEPRTKEALHLVSVAKIWVMADYFAIEELTDCCLKVIEKVTYTTIPLDVLDEFLEYAFGSETAFDSSLRKAAVSKLWNSLSYLNYDMIIKTLPEDALSDLVRYLEEKEEELAKSQDARIKAGTMWGRPRDGSAAPPMVRVATRNFENMAYMLDED